MRNAAERKSIRKAEKIFAEFERQRVEFVIAAMGTKQGRAWFHNLLAACSIFDGSFSGDALLEAFTKGQRNIGLLIYNDIVGHCPDHFVTMMNEANIKEIANDRRNDDNSGDDYDPHGAAGDEYTGSPD